MNSDILLHILPRLSKQSFLNLYNQDVYILNKTNLNLLMESYKHKIYYMSTRKLFLLFNFALKYKKNIYVDECINSLPESKKLSLLIYCKRNVDVNMIMNKLTVNLWKCKSRNRVNFFVENLNLNK
ncbi:hypothetical protein NCER_100778 [Vairimorpha ceranae BRL01]|uniref:Uncharacterized protein n=2 Tax=Vairimorpha ceranae TaxID=40302 RepID=C4V8F9_VAIC1|nr:hypothetical protein AAJ76_1500049190 [Vairimorpha ceranae]EEQ82488.1 hypothetical protein NCER_100778 [Vairimorpha ceranae BRL01]KAF5140434.1 hypothetical protein G9O61_00g012390 [Vairimorpha ceranae]KKO75666.1 hypothetical protein AAJ76_1500049190 [Vairimorpha ceranae]